MGPDHAHRAFRADRAGLCLWDLLAARRARALGGGASYQATDACRLEYLRRELDDPQAAHCGRCDNCTGRAPDLQVPQAGADAARQRLLRPGVGVEPRRMWPPGMKDLGISGASGKIPADRTAEPGRALGRLTDVGWGTTLRALLADEAPDGAVTDQLTDAVVKVLAAWDWSQRPAAWSPCRRAPGPS